MTGYGQKARLGGTYDMKTGDQLVSDLSCVTNVTNKNMYQYSQI